MSFGHIPNILVALSLLPLRIDTSDLVALWDSLPKQTVGGEIRSHLVKGQTALLSLETQTRVTTIFIGWRIICLLITELGASHDLPERETERAISIHLWQLTV